MSSQIANDGGTSSTMAHNDADTRSGSSCASTSHSLFHPMSVPECLVHKEKAAISLNAVGDDNPAISPALASQVAQKAFAFSVHVVNFKFRHDINTFRGCSGAIVFLLDRNQDGLVEETLYGQAIGIHAGAFEEVSRTADGSVTGTEKSNIAFALKGFAEQAIGLNG